jgi:murein L,D-transpeptidase YcbB/YkuD
MTRVLTTTSRRLPSALAFLALLVLQTTSTRAAEEGVAPDAGMTEIALRLSSPIPLAVEGITLDRDQLIAIYGARGGTPLWQGNPAWPAALEAAIADAGSHGIPPESLGLDSLQHALRDVTLDVADRDLLLTDRFLVYGAILAHGRVAIASIEDLWGLPAPVFDPASAIALLERSGPTAALQALAPTSSGYELLRIALYRYEQMVAAGGWQPLPVDSSLCLSDRGPLVALLRQRLAAEGALPENLAGSEEFDAALERALSSFQRSHGLLADGRLGPATLAALNVPAVDRVQQIRVNLERLRAMPHAMPLTRIEVQEASQVLTFYSDNKPALVSRVIVGAPIHPTPVLAAAVERLVLDPAWDVPASIVEREIQPRLQRDPGYLLRNHYVILGRGDGDPTGQDLDWRKTDILSMGWRLRQLPGPWNALGNVMLDMPNQFGVYLHDTPQHDLFALQRRALSHGCVRVAAVRDLGAALLGAALPAPGGTTRSVQLATPMPVYFFYQTAFADADGTVEFRDDICGRDARLGAAIALFDGGSSAPGPFPIADNAHPGRD